MRVRSVQVHDHAVERAEAGQRVAVNLAVARAQRPRVGATCSSRRAATRAPTGSTCSLEELEEIPAAVTVHVGTKAVPARVARDGRVRAAAPRGARSSPPAATASCCAPTRRSAAGIVLDPAPPRGARSGAARRPRGGRSRGDRAGARARAGDPRGARGAGAPHSRRARRAGSPGCPRPASWIFARGVARRAVALRCTARLAARAATQPARSRDPARRAAAARAVGARGARAPADRPAGVEGVPPGRHRAARRARRRGRRTARARSSEEEIVKVDDRELAAFLEDEDRLRPRRRRLRGLEPTLYDRARGRCCAQLDPITIATLRDALGVGRRTSQLLLERFDARRSDAPPRRRARSPAKPRVASARWSGGGRCPSGSSKPVRRGSPTLARFDSGAAPLRSCVTSRVRSTD